jgi:hypothetical protein
LAGRECNKKNAAPIWDGVLVSGMRPLDADADVWEFNARGFDLGTVNLVVLVSIDFVELVKRAGGFDHLGRLFQPERLGLLTHGIAPELLTCAGKNTRAFYAPTGLRITDLPYSADKES